MALNQESSSEEEHHDIAVGLFEDQEQAHRAIVLLHDRGFTKEQIGAAFRESKQPIVSSGTGGDSSHWFGQLRDIYQGETRPVRSQFVSSDFESSLNDLDIPRAEARAIARELGPGSAIVTVNAGSRYMEAEALLRRAFGKIPADRLPAERKPAEQRTSATRIEVPAENVETFSPPDNAEPGHIKLFGEMLRVHREKISSGDVRVRKEAVTTMETVQMPVTREHLVVERTDGRDAVGHERDIRIPLSEERVRIEKETVLQDEYKVGKRDVLEEQTLSGDVRKERLLIDSGDVEQHR